MKTIEIRMFAIERAVEILGVGTSDKDVVSKAKEIEAYIMENLQEAETKTKK